MPETVTRVDPATVSPRWLDQLVELVITTGYYQYAALGNPRGLPFKTQTREGFVLPYLAHTWVMPDERGELAACYIALTPADEEEIDGGDNWPDDTPGMSALGEVLEAFNARQPPDTFLLQAFAVRFDRQGRSAGPHSATCAQALFDHLRQEAGRRGCRQIALLVWASHPAAIRFYQRQGGAIIGQSDFRQTLLNDTLVEMRIPLR